MRAPNSSVGTEMKTTYKKVVLGGTFDKLHKGHHALICKAFEVGGQVLIGLSTDDFIKTRRKKHKVAPYDERIRELRNFLTAHGVRNRAEIIPLNDPYGPASSSTEIGAIIVSEETLPGAHEINEIRKGKGLPLLEIIVIRMVPSENGSPISTTRIYKNEVDREGRLLK